MKNYPDCIATIIRILGRCYPKAVIHYKKKHENAGKSDSSKMMFILDCDTEKDIEVINEVSDKLRNVGIMPILAVPGELLLLGEKVYIDLYKQGIEFINHGYKQHTVINYSGEYESRFFYNKLTGEEIENDIIRGHETIRKILKFEATVFRTPHFGSFCQFEQLNWLHELLKKMNYKFSTSSSPMRGILEGSIIANNGITELPVTGCYSYPLGIPDSYSFRFNPTSKLNKNHLIEELLNLSREMSQGNLIRCNLYADPSQIFDWPEYFDALEKFNKWNSVSVREYAEAN